MRDDEKSADREGGAEFGFSTAPRDRADMKEKSTDERSWVNWHNLIFSL